MHAPPRKSFRLAFPGGVNHMTQMYSKKLRRRISCATLGFLLLHSPALAATNTVTSLADGGAGSLRQLIASSAPGDTINIPLGGTIVLTSGELVITNNLTVTGPGAASLAISGNHASRVFSISNVTVSLSGITIRDGRAADGGAGGNGSHGGGIYNQGTLALSNCVITGNAAGNGGDGSTGGAGGVGGNGGGIYSLNTLTISYSSIIANTNGTGGKGGDRYDENSSGGHGGAGGFGGGIYSAASLAMTCCTIHSNAAGRGGKGGLGGTNYMMGAMAGNGGLGGMGGGIESANSSLTLAACTLSGNSAGQGGDGGDNTGGFRGNGGNGGWGCGIRFSSVSPTLRSSLIAGNHRGEGGARGSGPGSSGTPGTPGSISDITGGDVTSEGHNLFGTATSGSIGTDLTYTDDPRLGTAGTCGGSTIVAPLLASSPAIDAGDDALTNAPYSLVVDQRGSPRKTGSQVDIGAFEYAAQAPDIGLGTATVTFDETNGLSSSTLNPAVNLNGQSGVFVLQYGVTTNYGITTTIPCSEIYAVSTSLYFTNLMPGHLYHYRFVATNATGTTVGPDQTFTTAQFFAAGDFNGDGTVEQSELNSVYTGYWQNNPAVISNALGLGRTNVQLIVENSIGWDLSVQMSTNMSTWTNLPVRAVPVFHFTDPTATGSANRAYRLLAP